MSNRFKFRVWDDYLKQMWQPSDPYKKVRVGFLNGQLIDASFSSEEDGIYNACQAMPQDIASGRFVVQQFTGLKDSEGREIYEGDFLENFEYPIDFSNGSFWAAIDYGPTAIPLHEIYTGLTKVIGNIFENPELLSKQ